MKHFSRRCITRWGIAATVALGTWAIVPATARAQSGDIIQIVGQTNPLLHSSSKVYLGVELEDVNTDKAQTLKLKDAHGAVVTLIDHDAPAAQAGIQVNDVILSLNGQKVENVAQFWQMLYQYPAGKKVSVVISRSGDQQTVAVTLADRRAVEHEVWNRIGNGGDVFPSSAPGMGLLPGGGDSPVPGGFHLPFFGSTLNVGAMVEPLTAQMAEYLGIASGLMVKQVARKSEAAVAGLKSFDVILKVDTEKVTNVSGWDRALRSNRGKPIQVTILRDRKQQVLTLQVDSKHPQSKIEEKPAPPAGQGAVTAEPALAVTGH
jgi:serine protease Do